VRDLQVRHNTPTGGGVKFPDPSPKRRFLRGGGKRLWRGKEEVFHLMGKTGGCQAGDVKKGEPKRNLLKISGVALSRASLQGGRRGMAGEGWLVKLSILGASGSTLRKS